jgi:hypothetical protein
MVILQLLLLLLLIQPLPPLLLGSHAYCCYLYVQYHWRLCCFLRSGPDYLATAKRKCAAAENQATHRLVGKAALNALSNCIVQHITGS